ncbi:MAG: hypothetical protein JO100_10660 [Pseudonocardia sp.]|nr:hypothetical protein [Pseudonocardia sp.]
MSTIGFGNTQERGSPSRGAARSAPALASSVGSVMPAGRAGRQQDLVGPLKLAGLASSSLIRSASALVVPEA